MADCVALARNVAAAVASRFGIPVFLYEEASDNPARKNLEDIRRGEFEGLAAKLALPGWAPDFGLAAPHTTAGASVIGARMPLIAYNINLNTDRLDVARRIAAAIRHSSGGLRYVKAMGVMLEDRRIGRALRRHPARLTARRLGLGGLLQFARLAAGGKAQHQHSVMGQECARDECCRRAVTAR